MSSEFCVTDGIARKYYSTKKKPRKESESERSKRKFIQRQGCRVNKEESRVARILLCKILVGKKNYRDVIFLSFTLGSIHLLTRNMTKVPHC